MLARLCTASLVRHVICAVGTFTAFLLVISAHGQTLRIGFETPEIGFDPQAIDDLPSSDIAQMIFDVPLKYDPFARPAQIVAGGFLAQRPVISDGGKRYTFTLKPGSYFSDHPAFKGRKRELVAQDVVYSWKRLIDPKIASPYYWEFENKLVGEKQAREAAQKRKKFDYDAPFEGIKALDKYTFEVRFQQPHYQFEYQIVHQATFSPVAREVIEAHADDRGRNMAKPVGIGPYTLETWVRANRIVLVANPNFRDERFPAVPATQPEAMRALVGKKLPLSPRVEIRMVEESTPRLLMLQKGEIDMLYRVPPDLIPRVIDEKGVLRIAFAERGIRSEELMESSLNFTFFNMKDAIVGGYKKENIALRRAMLMGYNTEEAIRVINKGHAIPATQLIPPGQIGHDPTINFAAPYDPQLARALLDRFGYKDRDGDGYREMPDGKPLVVKKSSLPEARFRESDELWKKNMDAIGIRMVFDKQKWPELVEAARLGALQMWGYAWVVGSASGDSYTQLLYSKNAGQINDSSFNVKAFDDAYERAQTLPFGDERMAQYAIMSRVAAVHSVFEFGTHTFRTSLAQPWLNGYVPHPYVRYPFDLMLPDEAQRAAQTKSR